MPAFAHPHPSNAVAPPPLLLLPLLVLPPAVGLEKRFSAFDTSLATRLKESEQACASPPASGGAGGDDAPQPSAPDRPPLHKWGAEERELAAVFVSKRSEVHAALCDSVDTPSALKALEQLVRSCNTYMGDVSDVSRGGTLLGSIQRYFYKVLGAMGVQTAQGSGGGGGGGGGAAGGAASTADVANALSAYRDTLRTAAITAQRDPDATTLKELAQSILKLSDALRDETLPGLGIQIDDRPSGVAQVQVGDPKVMMAEAARRAEAAAEAAAAKGAKAAAKAANAAKEAAQLAVPPTEYFAAVHDALFEREAGYGELDEAGIPTLDADGEPLSKSQRKKLGKVLEKHKKKYEAAQAK